MVKTYNVWEKTLSKVIKPNENHKWKEHPNDSYTLAKGELKKNLYAVCDGKFCYFTTGLIILNVIFYPYSLEVHFSGNTGGVWIACLNVGVNIKKS